jgi:hypothetical protein
MSEYESMTFYADESEKVRLSNELLREKKSRNGAYWAGAYAETQSGHMEIEVEDCSRQQVSYLMRVKGD